jgi:hypothetical protein
VGSGFCSSQPLGGKALCVTKYCDRNILCSADRQGLLVGLCDKRGINRIFSRFMNVETAMSACWLRSVRLFQELRNLGGKESVVRIKRVCRFLYIFCSKRPYSAKHSTSYSQHAGRSTCGSSVNVLVILRYYRNWNTSKYDIRSSGMLGGVGLQLITDVSGQPMGPIFKGQAVQPTARNIPEERRTKLHRGGNLKSRTSKHVCESSQYRISWKSRLAISILYRTDGRTERQRSK